MNQIQAPVPEFKLAAPQLLTTVDDIADLAARALELGEQALARTSGEPRDALQQVLEHVRRIGFAADMSVADRTADMAEAWGIDQPPAALAERQVDA